MGNPTKRTVCALIGMITVAAWPMQALASVDQYNCAYKPGTDYGEGIAFGVDRDRNSILLNKHWAGSAYHPEFTLGDVSYQDKRLQFEFEFWNKGSVAMRERISVDLETMGITGAHYLYAADGGLLSEGQGVTGTCTKISGTPNDQDATTSPSQSETAKAAGSVKAESGLAVDMERLHTPKSGTALRKALMDAARGPIGAELGQAVVFKVSALNTDNQWAYLQATPLRPNGANIDWSQTRFAEEMRQDFMSDTVMVLMLKTGTEWRVIDYIIGPTDVAWYSWVDALHLPDALFEEH